MCLLMHLWYTDLTMINLEGWDTTIIDFLIDSYTYMQISNFSDFRASHVPADGPQVH